MNHPSPTIASSQNARILAALESAKGGWVPMPELGNEGRSMVVATRVSNIKARFRKTGDPRRIENKLIRGKGHEVQSFYRLVTG